MDGARIHQKKSVGSLEDDGDEGIRTRTHELCFSKGLKEKPVIVQPFTNHKLIRKDNRTMWKILIVLLVSVAALPGLVQADAGGIFNN